MLKKANLMLKKADLIINNASSYLNAQKRGYRKCFLLQYPSFLFVLQYRFMACCGCAKTANSKPMLPFSFLRQVNYTCR